MLQKSIMEKKSYSGNKDGFGYEEALYDLGCRFAVDHGKDSFLDYCVRRLGDAMGVSRVYIFENSRDNRTTSNTHEWTNEGIKPLIGALQDVSYDDFKAFKKNLSKGDIFCSENIFRGLSRHDSGFLSQQGIKSILIVPIFVHECFFGFLGFDECKFFRKWRQADIFILRTAAHMIGTHIGRDIGKKTRESLEEEIYATRGFLKNVIDSTDEAICSTDTDAKILVWNRSAEQMTGFRASEVLGKNIYKLGIVSRENTFNIDAMNLDPAAFLGWLRKRGGSGRFEVECITKSGCKKTLSVSVSAVKNINSTVVGLVHVARDITRLKNAQDSISPGNMYLIRSDSQKVSFSLFEDAIKKGRKGLCISRSRPEDTKGICSRKFSFYWLNEPDESECEKIIENVRRFIEKNRNAAILLERSDYVIGRNNFSRFLDVVYKINSLIRNSDAVCLLRINPKIMEQGQMIYLEKELRQLSFSEHEDRLLTKDSIDLLRFLLECEVSGRHASVKDIASSLKITRPTANERIRCLLSQDLVKCGRMGRNRLISLTENSRSFLKRT